MVASAGRKLLLKLGAGSPLVYTTIAGGRSTGMTINGTEVDQTTFEDDGARTLLPDAGVTSMTMSFAGVYKDSAGQASLMTACQNRTLVKLKLEDAVNNNIAYTGDFQVTSVEHTGAEGDVQMFNANFASSGAVTITNT